MFEMPALTVVIPSGFLLRIARQPSPLIHYPTIQCFGVVEGLELLKSLTAIFHGVRSALDVLCWFLTDGATLKLSSSDPALQVCGFRACTSGISLSNSAKPPSLSVQRRSVIIIAGSFPEYQQLVGM